MPPSTLSYMFKYTKFGRAEVIWPDRLVLEPDRQIDPDRKMRSGIWAVPGRTPIWHSFRGLVFGSVCFLWLFGFESFRFSSDRDSPHRAVAGSIPNPDRCQTGLA